MFDNIGGKIKAFAKAVAWVGIVFFCLLGVAGGGEVVAVIGSVASWVGSFVLYGFGQLIENTDKLVKNSDKLVEATKKMGDL